MTTGLALMLSGLMLIASPVFASNPATSSATMPSKVGSVTVTWKGSFPPAVNPSGSCTGPAAATADTHTVTLAVPNGVPGDGLMTRATFTINAGTDAIISVEGPTDATTADADNGGGGAAETIQFSSASQPASTPVAGDYKISACSFLAGGPQAVEYTGSATFETARAATGTSGPPQCPAPAEQLEFTQAYIDRSRAGGEPIVATHPSGRLLWGSHAGTTHFYGPAAPDEDTASFLRNYQGQTYYYFSGDNGKTWEFVERLPNQEDQEAGLPNSGFSDPEFAIDKAGQVYVSEINLVNVAFSKSTDGGRSYTLQSLLGLTLSDRQWMEADQKDVLYLVANTFGGGSGANDPVTGDQKHKMFKSTDGGKTFTAGEEANPNGTNDIKVDKSNGNVYELTLGGGVLQMARFENMRGVNSGFGDHVKFATIAKGVQVNSSLSQAFDIDDDGNLYVAWSETGEGARPGGVWYSASGDKGRTWSVPVRIDPNDKTDIWPWVAVGDSGKVAISWLQNATHIPGNNAENAPDDSGWSVMVGHTLNGLGCAGGAQAAAYKAAASTPGAKVAGFKVTKASSRPVHMGTICQGGTTCQAMAIDRRLGDYFADEIDSVGHAYVSVSDTRQGGSVALPLVIRQTGGDRFIAATNRRKPPGHTGKGVNEGPDGGNSPYIEPDDGDGGAGGVGALPATGGGAVLLGLLTFGTGLFLRRRRRDDQPEQDSQSPGGDADQ
jgi:hypothetical protein